MTKLNQKGAIEIIVAIVLIIAAFVFLVFMLINQSGEGQQASGGDASETNANEQESNLAVSRRDTQRKSDIGRLIAANERYASYNNGVYVSEEQFQGGVLLDYISTMNDDEFVDPKSEQSYVLVVTEPGLGEMSYRFSAECPDNENAPVPSANQRTYAIYTKLEKGDYYCLDNA